MLIQVQQHDASVTLSFVNEKQLIETKTYPIAQYNGIGPYNYRVANYETDPEIVKGLTHFQDNRPIKKVKSWKMEFDTLREFLLMSLPKEEVERIFTMDMPHHFKVDIEINVGNEEIFPDPYLAARPIDSIQITAPNLNTVVITCNSRVKKAGTPEGDEQIRQIEERINQHYEGLDMIKTYCDRIKYSHIVYDTEEEMLTAWWRLVNTRLHRIGFWNGDGFDKPYLWKRCEKLGIDIGLGSPTGEKSERDMWPRHRFVEDDMVTVKSYSYDLGYKQSLSLNHIAQRILGEKYGKVSYEGSFSDLYNGDIIRYMTYGAVDTISQQLIHLHKNYASGSEAMAFYCKIPITEVSKTTALVHAVIWDELYRNNQINAEEYYKKEKTPYGGGYVKQPVRKFCMYPVGVDFSALYPRTIQTCNISFENYLGKVKSPEHKKQMIATGHFVSVDGNIYKNDKTYCLKKVQDKFLSERYLYKDLQFAIWQQVLPSLEEELKRRGIDTKSL